EVDRIEHGGSSSPGGGSGLVAWPVFKTATEKPPAAPVGSIPTRSRQLAFYFVLFLFAILARSASAQEPPPASQPKKLTVDSVPLRITPIKPMKAFVMSLLVPGWGQARLDRKLTAGLFIMFEGVSAGMTMKTIRELHYLERTAADTALLRSKRTQRQD